MSRKARTKLVLEFGNGDKSFTWNIAHLSYSAGFYRFVVGNKNECNIRLLDNYFGTTLYFGDNLTILNTELDCNVAFPKSITVKPWQIYKLRMLVQQPFHVLLHILSANNELIDIVVLKTFHMLPTTSAINVGAQIASIYPGAQLHP